MLIHENREGLNLQGKGGGGEAQHREKEQLERMGREGNMRKV